ncbi:hypothetical protein BDY21DRAFT_286019 [Lineolata rhizophorae]|uniref:Adenylate cyclase n=1 Tax=Lineolata rhizophorae TaxID=578093 RepID=A0A6A6P1F1_9PEZI|nr:hypothetical protein BDY21DRAFT_286019 [Lineolata rhizophorae]
MLTANLFPTRHRDSEISPGSSHPPRRDLSQIAPWERHRGTDFTNYRKDLAALDTSSGNKVPQISRQPPTASSPAPPWIPGNNGSANMPSSVFPNFLNDSNEDFTQLSPGFRPGSGRDDGYPDDDRRPSVASATTASSTGSKGSITRGFHKKLQGFFGDEFVESRQSSDASLGAHPGYSAGDQSSNSSRPSRHRNNSVPNPVGSRPGSPMSSRPRTPQISSEVTPWEFQDVRVIAYLGPSQERYSSDQQSVKSGKGHKLHLPGHRHNRSKDEALRPMAAREDSGASVRRGDFPLNSGYASNATSKTALAPRSSSPTPSSRSGISGATTITGSNNQRSPQGNAGREKRSILDKIRRRGDKGERPVAEALRDLPSSTASLQSVTKASRQQRAEPSPGNARGKKGTMESDKSSKGGGKDPHKKEHGGRFPLGKSKRTGPELPSSKDPNQAGPDVAQNDALWFLDTDLSHIDDIVNLHPPMTPPNGEAYNEWPPDGLGDRVKTVEESDRGAWDAPDSWAVKRAADETMGRLRELDEDGNVTKEENMGPPFCVRIFRVDSTFAVLSVALNTTVTDIIQILGKKTLLQDDLDNYHIVMRKHDTSRQLEPQERPLYIQKRLLEQAGYTEKDRLEDVGREDNSYLCRFTFLPAKMSGYSSLEKDPGFGRMSKFSHIDLQGRNLITIPIILYQKATEIISLNLSRNLSLDLPKDFIQACTNLREIKYTSNEAWRLPPSMSLASRLTMLDVSNNRLEQLEHANLDKLSSLISLRLSNNKLYKLPRYFGSYRALRSLNLSSNSLPEFPDFLCDVQTLEDIDVSFNSISSLPNIGKLVNLERLWATNNKLSGSFPDSISSLTSLREIDVRFNALNNMDIMSRLPNLECLRIGHNSISAFEGTFPKIRVLFLDHNPVTRFNLTSPVTTLLQLNIASAKLSQLPHDLYFKVANLTQLILDKNHFVSLSNQIGRLSRLEYFSVARNGLNNLPSEVGRLQELRYLDVRENNLNQLPPEIWHAKRLETLNVSSNVLESFPKPGNPPAGEIPMVEGTPGSTPSANSMGPTYEELGRLEDFQLAAHRRPSQASSGLLSVGSSPGGGSQRKASITSTFGANGRKTSVASKATTEGTLTPVTRKDSSLSSRMTATFAGTLRHLFLADNRLSDDVFDELALLPELRIVNLSYNVLYDIPPRTIRRWQHLTELYLSGNDLTSLPSEDLEEVSSLRVLHINSNKFQVLPAELGKVSKLAILDVGNNSLKYNVSNWPYDWNWNWNRNLKYLNLSGNKRLEIKPAGSFGGGSRNGKDLTDFTSLTNLRVLGLMDVTLMVPSVPDQSEDRRVRTSGSSIGSMAYGMADALGRNEHLSTMDLTLPKFRGRDDETIVGMFDGQTLSSGGSKIAKYLHEHFKNRFAEELDRLRENESYTDALRRTYLALNKDIATYAMLTPEMKESARPSHRGSVTASDFTDDDLKSGSVATVMYLKEMDLYVSNVGDAQALLIQSEGGHRIITRKHDPAEPTERARIREAGGFVSRQGRLNDYLEVSRAFGYAHMTPAVIAAPHVSQIRLQETDEMILLASRELWDYLTPDFAVDVARSERGDLMRAAQKLRDLAIAFGSTGKIMVMLVGVSDLRTKKGARFRTHSMSMGPSGSPDEYFASRRGKRTRDAVANSKLARLDQEVEAPTGEVSLVFTDIKNSTLLWETYPIAMQSAIRMHNELMRRHLRIIGGYEVKTEGDAFMVAFPTVTSALLWCFTIQSQLLEVQWPQEILSSVHGQVVLDADDNVIFRGLSVRMGIHWGTPVCEVDPVTKRMDYFGPMVNRAARIESVADGGQITVSSDFIAEVQRLLETHMETDTRNGSVGSEDTFTDDVMSAAIRRELRSLSSQGFEVKDLGERRLKGLENPEYIYLMYPHSLAGRLAVQQQRAAEAEKDGSAGAGGSGVDSRGTKMPDSQLTIDTQSVWDLWNVSLRLEMLCSALECAGSTGLKPPETALLERMKERGGEISDRFLLNFVEHQVSRIESCITALQLRNLVRPFKEGMLQQACAMQDIFGELEVKLAELEELRKVVG